MRNPIMLATMLLLLCSLCVHAQESVASNVPTVEQFIAAFNAHDSAAMGALVADDVAWLSIAGEEVMVEVKGKNELVTSMNAYFESCPTCQSELSGIISTADRVSAIEIASWQGKSGSKSQRSISVYEFAEGVIQRVYYFPSE